MDTTTPPNASLPRPARQNAMRHGLTARSIVIEGVETEAEWDAFHTDVVDALAPGNSVEFVLANRIAELLWRLRRVPRAERDLIAASQEKDDAIEARRLKIDAIEEEERRDVAGTLEPGAPRKRSFYASALVPLEVPPPPPDRRRVLPDDASLHHIIRYEAHLNRQLSTTMHELEALQARRNGLPAPLARLDVHLSEPE